MLVPDFLPFFPQIYVGATKKVNLVVSERQLAEAFQFEVVWEGTWTGEGAMDKDVLYILENLGCGEICST